MDMRDFFVFSFCRNPFTRMISVYEDKIIKRRNHLIVTGYPASFFYSNMSFKLFVKRVCSLPDLLSERHFTSQNNFIFPKRINKIDYIGKLENFENSIKNLKIDLSIIPKKNRTKKKPIINYYDRSLINSVYKRYKKDIQLFGYEKEYETLLNRV
jgi:hypothetical protein